MALPTLGRRVRNIYSQLFAPLLPCPITRSPSSSSSNPLRHHLSQVFHQTLQVSSQSSAPQTPHFSTVQLLSAQNMHYLFYLHGHGFRTYDLHDPCLLQFLEILRRVADLPTEAGAMLSLDESGIEANREMLCSAIWALREIDVFGSQMGYAYADDPCKAIRTFQMMEKFSLTPDQEAYLIFLNLLCSHGYIEEAEEFMLVNRKLFPLETEGFNIILNGWCNISVDVFEAKRVWWEMSKCCMVPNALV